MIPKGSIRIENRDSSTLLSLSLSSDGGVPDVVAQNVPSGASVVVALPKTGECVYDVEARFEDWSWSRVPRFDLCKDQTLNVGESSSAASAPAEAVEAVSSPRQRQCQSLHRPRSRRMPSATAKTRRSALLR